MSVEYTRCSIQFGTDNLILREVKGVKVVYRNFVCNSRIFTSRLLHTKAYTILQIWDKFKGRSQ